MSKKMTVLLLVVLFFAATGRGANCTARATSDVIEVQFMGCDDSSLPSKITLDVDGKSVLVIREGLYWKQKLTTPIRVVSTRVTPRVSGVRAYCRYGEPVRGDGSQTSCVARYVFYCDQKLWQLRVAATPQSVRLPYERLYAVKDDASPCSEMGEFALPTNAQLVDVGESETVKVKIMNKGYFIRWYAITWQTLREAGGVIVLNGEQLKPEPGAPEAAAGAVRDTRAADAYRAAAKKNTPTDLSEVRFSWKP